MARKHYYKWLVNQEGQPISNADVYVYLAETSLTVVLYTSENGIDVISTTPQLTTNNLGYFEFWIGDANDTYGYDRDQKFKIKWIRDGVEESYIDNISIFDTDIEEVDETDTETTGDSLFKNKLVSNYLARKWDLASEATMTSAILSEDYTITNSDNMDTLFLSGDITVLLPDVSIKRNIKFGKYDSNTTTATISASTPSISGNDYMELTEQYSTLVLESDGDASWYIF